MTTRPDCSKCEELLQPFLDRSLTAEERATVQHHIENCSACARCYKLEEVLWKHVRNCCDQQASLEFASSELKQKLSDLRAPLV